jgi:hypothetical protein
MMLQLQLAHGSKDHFKNETVFEAAPKREVLSEAVASAMWGTDICKAYEVAEKSIEGGTLKAKNVAVSSATGNATKNAT